MFKEAVNDSLISEQDNLKKAPNGTWKLDVISIVTVFMTHCIFNVIVS